MKTINAADINGKDDTTVWWFTIDTTPPEVQGLTAKAISSSQIKLEWNNIEDAVKYEIYRNDEFIKKPSRIPAALAAG